jgi:nucleoside-diphosphate-sugar epimerase
MTRIFIFGLGYSAKRIAARVAAVGWEVVSTGSGGTLAFEDEGAVRLALSGSSHVLSSVPPSVDGDPVLNLYGDAVRRAPWIGYLSSTGVYGDCGGAWVDESAPIRGRRESRNQADGDWLSLGARVFRLPGIYGPGRSALDRVRQGKARRVDLPDQVFSRVHVDDIASGVVAGFGAPAGAYNLADDFPGSQNTVIELAATLLGVEPPPLVPLDDPSLSPMARAFYAENRRVANGKAKRVLDWSPKFADYRVGLAALLPSQIGRGG